MSQSLSLSELRQEGMYKLTLGARQIEDIQVRSERVISILTEGVEVLDHFDEDAKGLSDYGVTNDYCTEATIPAYDTSGHSPSAARFELYIEHGHRDDESGPVSRVEIRRDGDTEVQLFVAA